MRDALACLLRKGLPAGLLWLLATVTPTRATNTTWLTRAWQSDDGLPNNTVAGLAQTTDGYLWLGTPSGLVRFDGIHFEDFSPTNFIAPPNRGIITMLHGRDGALWLALDRGALVCLHGGSSRAFIAGLPNLIPNGLAEDAEGGLWIAYRGGTVYHLREGNVAACTARDGLPEGSDICALTSDTKGHVWFAKAGQFGTISNGFFQIVRRFDPLPARLAASRTGGLWFCSGFRLWKKEADGQFQDFGDFRPERGGTVATVLLEDHKGAVWVGTSYSGLFRHDESGFQTIQTSHQEISSLTEDREGNLWVGTAGGGLNRIRRRAVALEDQQTGLPFAAVWSICEDAAGTLWAATQNGALVRRVGGKWSPLPATTNWPLNATCVAADAQGCLWVGNRFYGLYCWRDGQFVSWNKPAEMRTQTLHTLLISKGGDLWLGGENPPAIQRLRGGQLRTFPIPPDGRVIRAIAEDAAGNIWAGTSKGLLLRITGDQLTEVTPRPSRELASVRCLYATPDGALWIGYAGWGVGRLKDGHYAEIRTKQGLHDDYISHIIADDKGWLWFGANHGIFKVRQRDLKDLAEGHLPRVNSIYYGRGEGLPSLQATFGASPGAARSRDGRLWLPMRTALAVVDPEQFGDGFNSAPVLLRRVLEDDRTVAWYGGVLPPMGGAVLDLSSALGQRSPQDIEPSEASTRRSPIRLRLPPGHHRLEFEYAAPSFTSPENVHFRYRLVGYDDVWIEAGTRRTASYSRLPAGDYVFNVEAWNSDGTWSKIRAALSLVVAPFFWQTWWFGFAALAGFTLSIIAIVRYVSFRRLHRRLRLLEQQAALHKERARIAKDIHDDLGANLTQIALLGELAQQDRDKPEKASERIGEISSTARQAIKSLDEIVWAVNPRNDTLAHLVDYAGQFALDYLRLAAIRCRLDFPENTPAREVSTDVRHNLFLAIKEALNNIVKHARATEVWLRVGATDDGLRIAIEDNGCGFDHPPHDAGADGLRNMRQRLAEVGGKCRIQSQPGAGTKVTLDLPWPGR